MPSVQPEARATKNVAPENQQLFALISSQILQALGEPAGFRAVHVKPLWEHHYRANVVVGEDVTTTTVAHSYFVVADAAGKIVAATPAIKRQY